MASVKLLFAPAAGPAEDRKPALKISIQGGNPELVNAAYEDAFHAAEKAFGGLDSIAGNTMIAKRPGYRNDGLKITFRPDRTDEERLFKALSMFVEHFIHILDWKHGFTPGGQEYEARLGPYATEATVKVYGLSESSVGLVMRPRGAFELFSPDFINTGYSEESTGNVMYLVLVPNDDKEYPDTQPLRVENWKPSLIS